MFHSDQSEPRLRALRVMIVMGSVTRLFAGVVVTAVVHLSPQEGHSFRGGATPNVA